MKAKSKSDLIWELETNIKEFRELADINLKSGRPKLNTLGDVASFNLGRSAGLHQALFLIAPERAKKL